MNPSGNAESTQFDPAFSGAPGGLRDPLGLGGASRGRLPLTTRGDGSILINLVNLSNIFI